MKYKLSLTCSLFKLREASLNTEEGAHVDISINGFWSRPEPIMLA